MNSSRKRIVVLISGSGSNLQALIDASRDEDYPAEVVAVISNCASAYGLTRAQQNHIPTVVLDHRQFTDRSSFDRELRTVIEQWDPDIVVLAGFMRILTPEFVDQFQGKLLNIHPSLLPKYPGLHTHRRALEAGDREHGVTVHFVTRELDGGPTIVQARVPVESTDTELSLAQRVLIEEHRLYPLAVRWLAEGRICLKDQAAFFDQQPIAPSGVSLETGRAGR